MRKTDATNKQTRTQRVVKERARGAEEFPGNALSAVVVADVITVKLLRHRQRGISQKLIRAAPKLLSVVCMFVYSLFSTTRSCTTQSNTDARVCVCVPAIFVSVCN